MQWLFSRKSLCKKRSLLAFAKMYLFLVYIGKAKLKSISLRLWTCTSFGPGGFGLPGNLCYFPNLYISILLAVEKCPQLAALSWVAHETINASDTLCLGLLPAPGVAKQVKTRFHRALWGRIKEEDKEGQFTWVVPRRTCHVSDFRAVIQKKEKRIKENNP